MPHLALPIGRAARPARPTSQSAEPPYSWRGLRGPHLLAGFVVAHVVIWALIPLIVRWPGALWDDMLETYAWSQEWQLGYYKHPPFYSWIVGLWFQVFPRTDWAYYLLSSANVGLGFIGVWMLAGRFVGGDARLLSVNLLAFMPYYNYMASNFNANTVLLSLWPWTTYAFVRSLESRTSMSGAMFGALAAASLLSKYYSILLLASCFAASLAHPLARRYFSSPAPYVALAVACALFAPHIWWAFANDLPPVKYALSKTGRPWLYMLGKALGTALACVAINAITIGVLIAMLCRQRPGTSKSLGWELFQRNNGWIVILAAGPFFFTLMLGVLGYVKVSVNFLIPAMFMVPLAVLVAFETVLKAQDVRHTLRAVTVLLVVAMMLAMPIGYVSFAVRFTGAYEVSPAAARDAARIWNATFNAPVRIVSGSEKYSLAQTFYGPDKPAEFTHFSFDEAPWITRDRIASEGLLAICIATDTLCLQKARAHAHSGAREFSASHQKSYFDLVSPQVDLVYIMTPPR
jgi:4-amino-4-deoxy-L-arabinose transferase-like glycosyltransferase